MKLELKMLNLKYFLVLHFYLEQYTRVTFKHSMEIE